MPFIFATKECEVDNRLAPAARLCYVVGLVGGRVWLVTMLSVSDYERVEEQAELERGAVW